MRGEEQEGSVGAVTGGGVDYRGCCKGFPVSEARTTGLFWAAWGHGLIEDLEGARGCCIESRQSEGKVGRRGSTERPLQ